MCFINLPLAGLNCAAGPNDLTNNLVSFQGRCPFRVYMKPKPVKYGMRSWTVADADIPYVLNQQVYFEKLRNTFQRVHRGRVVMDLLVWG